MVANQREQVVRVRLRYPDLETFIEKYAPNVTRGGIFLASREPRPVGEVLRFEVLLRQGGPVLSGQGRVTWVKEFNPAEPHRPYGMGVQFLRIDPSAQSVLDRLLQRKQQRSASVPVVVRARADTGESDRPTEQTAVLGGGDEELDEAALRRILERARLLSGRTDDLEALLTPEPEETVTLSQALDDLPRLLAPRRPTGPVRVGITGSEPGADPDDNTPS